jgi:hypothetical protein
MGNEINGRSFFLKASLVNLLRNNDAGGSLRGENVLYIEIIEFF